MRERERAAKDAVAELQQSLSLNWSHNMVCYTRKLLLKTISVPHNYHRVITRAPVSSLTSES